MNKYTNEEVLAMEESAKAANERGELTHIKLKSETSAAPEGGFWQIPNAYMKKLRKLSLNDVRGECMRLAAALMDQRNANMVLSERLKAADTELRDLRVRINKANDGEETASDSTNESMEGQDNVK